MPKNPKTPQEHSSRPQSPQDMPDYQAGYLGDVADDWRRGAGESAEGRPGFDHSQARFGRRGK